MKKILLAFMGMVFFAHMVHAANQVFYKLIRKDAMNEQHIIYPNSKGGLYNGWSGWVNYTAVASQYINNSGIEGTACKFAGWEKTPSSSYPENSQYNRGLIVCDLTRMAVDTDDPPANGNGGYSKPYMFWQWSGQESRGYDPCEDYMDTMYGQNAIRAPSCYTWKGYHMDFRVRMPNRSPDEAWWKHKKRDDWAPQNNWTGSGDNPAAWVHHVMVNEYLSGNENVSWSDKECNHWGDSLAKGCADNFYSTIMSRDSLYDGLRSKNLHCRKPDGSLFTDDSYKVKLSKSRYSSGVVVLNVTREDCPTTYYDGSHTTAYVEFFSEARCNAAKARNPNTSTGCDTRYRQDVTLSFNSVPCRDYNGRTQCGDYTRTYPYSSRIFKCKKAYNQIWGSKLEPDCYAVYGLTFKDSYQTGWTYGNYTQDITTARTSTQSYYPEMTCQWDGKDASYNWPHDSYVDKNLVCTCKANTFLGEDACNAKITDSDMQYCEYDSSNGYCSWRLKSCADWSGERFKSESACQYKRNKSNRILTTYCINRKDGACNWSLETATNTVKSCKGDSGYIKKIDNNRACQRIKAK